MLASIRPVIVCFSIAVASSAADAKDAGHQSVETPPVTGRLQVVSRPKDVGSLLTVRIEVEVPSLSLEESLTTGQPARFRAEPRFGDWYRIPNLILLPIDSGEESRQAQGAIVFHWTCRWEAELPGNYTLPPLRIACKPALSGGKPVEIVFEEVPATVAALIPGDLALAARPRPVIATLPIPPSRFPRWLALILVILAWIGLRTGCAHWWRSARELDSTSLSNSPVTRALEQLQLCRSSQEAYQILRQFVVETCALDLAKLSAEDLSTHPRLSEPAKRALAPLVDELQSGAFSETAPPLTKARRKRLQEFLRTFEE